MKKPITGLRAYIGRTGVYFLVTMLLFGLAALALGQVSSPFSMAMLWCPMLFSALLALCDLVRAVSFIRSAPVRECLRGILAVAVFAFSFTVVTDVIETTRTALVGVLAFTLLEILLTVIRSVTRVRDEAKKSASSDYRNLFTPKDNL